MFPAKNIFTELTSIVVCGVAIGLLMAVTANAFVQTAVIATEYRTTIPWLEINLGTHTYSLSSIVSLLLAAALITFVRKWLNIKDWGGPADSIYAAHSENASTDTKKGLGSTLAALIVTSGGGSVGQYGPLVHFGSTIGLFIKNYFSCII